VSIVRGSGHPTDSSGMSPQKAVFKNAVRRERPIIREMGEGKCGGFTAIGAFGREKREPQRDQPSRQVEKLRGGVSNCESR